MNEDVKQILAELRKLRQINQAASIISVVALLTVVAFYGWYRTHTYPSWSTPGRNQVDSWQAVRSAMDHFEYERAADIAQRIVQKTPNDYYGYAYLGNIALAAGKVTEAEKYYVRADELLPNEQNEKTLAAIRTRLTREASASPTATPP